ncbi:Hypothetical Protein FCC1311_023752 [Hondaea fermentalgiana]|uniref:Laminin IV type A domain-containing protein n=1 Tax=Hondaea fermentalgiana TaxID=2315210 RepID=A0A2R5G6K2_9STRA|nr:Hypothetical Protein FCC1311_023752 [Hondaea fermentalgiana]|eukprot:GBG26155.1 Hypothetical Protein FCC1311_023752 [Hondaea fermentalgiana]
MRSLVRAVVAALIAALSVSHAAAANTVPKAHHLVYRVAPGKSVEISLVGYDYDGDKLQATITSLPAAGTLYDLAKVYAQHGHSPKYSTSTVITSAGHPVPVRSKLRIMYEAPRVAAKPGKLATFSYTVSDGQAASAQGHVTIIADTEVSDHVLAASDFRDGADGWTILSNSRAAQQAPVHERSSYRLLNHFIYAVDELLDIDRNGIDRKQWLFSAPSKFLGFQAWAYNGELSFSLGAFSGDFSRPKNPDANLAVLECRACARGAGMRFAYKLSSVTFTGSPQRFNLGLSETAGWLKLPTNSLLSATAPSQCEFVEMLDNLSAIHILGDHTLWYETVGLDDVHLKSRATGKRHVLPESCLCRTVGTQC